MLSAKLLRMFNVFIFNEDCVKIGNFFHVAIFFLKYITLKVLYLTFEII